MKWLLHSLAPHSVAAVQVSAALGRTDDQTQTVFHQVTSSITVCPMKSMKV